MNLKETLSFSAILHFCFFAAVLLLSADFFESSGKKLNEKIVFIELFKDTDESKDRQFVIKANKLMPEKSQQIKTETTPVHDIQNEIIPAKTEAARKSSDNLELIDLNAGENPANNILLANYKTGEDNVIDIPYGQEADIKGSLDLPVSGNDGISKDKDSGIIEIIRNSIEKAKIYPILARKRGIEGTVYISFRVNSEGKPNDIKILNSSGSHILDNATLDIVKKAAPFPHIDSSVEVPVAFRLN